MLLQRTHSIEAKKRYLPPPLKKQTGAGQRLSRQGLTIVEVLTVTAIIAVLLSLLATAVMHSRERARQLTCQSRLRQIGIATTNFVERVGHYPRGPALPYSNMAWFGDLLSDLGHHELQHELYARATATNGGALQLYWRTNAVPYFQCPSDPGTAYRWNTSYAVNEGSELTAFEEDYPSIPHTHGVRGAVVGNNGFPDGLTNTAFVAERLSELPTPQDRRGRWKTPIAYVDLSELDRFADLCGTMPVNALGLGSRDNGEIVSYLIYDHIMTPNQPSCINENWNYAYSTYASSSEHLGGVNVLFADGSVRFISNLIARPIWRAMGTRDGNEAVSFK